LYAQSSTPDGVQLCRKLGFEEITSPPYKMPRQFMLNIETSNSPFVQKYRELLRQYRTTNLDNNAGAKLES
jgi:hypothetical protein